MTGYEVRWQRNISVGCSDQDEGRATITDGSTDYEIVGLEEDSSYSVNLRAFNDAGSGAVSDTIPAMTVEAGMFIKFKIRYYKSLYIYH